MCVRARVRACVYGRVRGDVLDFEKKDARPRLRFWRITSSKRRTEGSAGCAFSRSWMNSWKAAKHQNARCVSQSILFFAAISRGNPRGEGANSPCVSDNVVRKSVWSAGAPLRKSSILKL